MYIVKKMLLEFFNIAGAGKKNRIVADIYQREETVPGQYIQQNKLQLP
jgi:hypothetical protein